VVWAVSLSTMELSSHGLTPVSFHCEAVVILVFGVWWENPGKPKIIPPVLYPQKIKNEANPKVISGRTSYYQA